MSTTFPRLPWSERCIPLYLLVIAVLIPCSCASAPDPYVAGFVQRIDEQGLREYSESLAAIGSRPWRNRHRSDATITFIEDSLLDAGYQVRSAELAGSGGETPYVNVVAEIRGISRPEQVVELGAHYDTVPFCPGADDNGSGVTGVLATARALAGARCSKTIRFVFFCAEEAEGVHSGLGSRTHVQNVLARDTESVEGVVVLDPIGYAVDEPASQRTPVRIPFVIWPPGTGDFVAIIGNSESVAIGNLCERAARRYMPDLKYYSLKRLGGSLKDGARSDHSVYWRSGLPGLLLTDTGPFRSPYNHQPSDRIDTLNFTFMTQVVCVTAAAMLEWAEAGTVLGKDHAKSNASRLVVYREYCDGPSSVTPFVDPTIGMSIGELSREQACRKIVTDFWNAAVQGDDELVTRLWRGLTPAANVPFLEENRPTELIDVGDPYRQKGCFEGTPTLVVPCRVRYTDGAIRDQNIIVTFRDVGVTESCLIIGRTGAARQTSR